MKTIARLLGIVQPYRWWMLLAALLGFATIGSGVGLLTTSAYIIAKAALHPSFHELQLGIAAVRLFGIARGGLRYAERLVTHSTTFRILGRIRIWFYASLQPLAPARLQRYRSGDLLQRITGDIDTLENLYARVVAPPLTAALVSLLLWFLMGTFSPVFSTALLCFHAAAASLPVATGRLNRGTASRIVRLQTELQAETLDYLQGMDELLLFGRVNERRERLASLKNELLRLQRRQLLIRGAHESATGLLMNGAVLTLLWLLAPQVNGGMLDGVFTALIVVAVMASFEAFLPLPDTAGHLEESALAGKRLFEIIDSEPEITVPENPEPFPAQSSVSFRTVGFTYPGTSRPALSEVSFHISEHEKTAVVGPSGSGKSTIANLLLGFWRPAEGAVSVGGREIGTLDPETLRRRTATVTQHTYLFGDTLRNNLLLAKPDATDEELKTALKFAGLETFGERLDDWAGQHGMRLSGGERQRMAVARMVLQDAPCIVLDEATANLDAVTGRTLMESVRRFAARKTLIVITHRLREMETFDRILVMDDGRLRESGTHRELMEKKGLYASMWSLQHRPETASLTGNGI